MVERKVLCVQWRERFVRHGFDHVGLLQGENTVAMWAPILVATHKRASARNSSSCWTSPIWHQTHDKVLEPAAMRECWVSAHHCVKGLGKRFDKLVIGSTIKELTDAGHLVPARVFAPNRAEMTEALLRSTSGPATTRSTNCRS